MVQHGFVDHAPVHRAPFALIAFQQAIFPPALHGRGELPAEVDGIADTEVHAITAVRRMQMACIAGQKHAPIAIALCQQLVRFPIIDRQDLR